MMGIKINIDLKGMEKKLSKSNMAKGQWSMANQMLVDMNENTVPMRDGDLRQLSSVSANGKQLVWSSVYARAQYRGTNGKAIFLNYTTPGTGPFWDLRAKNMFMSDWIDAFTKGADL